MASSLATASPGCFIQLAIVTSETDSPTLGTSIFMAVPPDAFFDVLAGAASFFGAAAFAPEPLPRRAIKTPISATSPSATNISSSTPSSGETSSCAALSVSSSTKGSSFLTVSPTALNHCAMVTSETLSPTFGILISVMFRLYSAGLFGKSAVNNRLLFFFMLSRNACRCRGSSFAPDITKPCVFSFNRS